MSLTSFCLLAGTRLWLTYVTVILYCFRSLSGVHCLQEVAISLLGEKAG